jgi:hypothetical protein
MGIRVVPLLSRTFPDNGRQLMSATKKIYHRKKQLMERYSLCEKTIDRWRKAGLIPPPDFVQNHIPFWSNEALDQADRKRAKEKGEKR